MCNEEKILGTSFNGLTKVRCNERCGLGVCTKENWIVHVARRKMITYQRSFRSPRYLLEDPLFYNNVIPSGFVRGAGLGCDICKWVFMVARRKMIENQR